MKDLPENNLCVRCHKRPIKRKKWGLCLGCYSTCYSNGTLFSRQIYYLRQTRLCENLTNKYGSEILKDFELTLTKPFWNLTEIAQKYSFSREYARQIFKRLYGIPFHPIQSKKTQKIRQDLKPWSYTCDPATKMAIYKKKSSPYIGAKVELLVKQKCEELGFKFTSNRRATSSIDCRINGYWVEVKSRKKSYRTNPHGPKYFTFQILKSQTNADFVIAYIYPQKTFYIFPNHTRSRTWAIRDGESSHYNAGTNHEEHKEAWHLLK